MEHVIALEWGRFPGETQFVPAEDRKRNGDAKSGTGEAIDEKARQATLQRLESALAMPPEPGMSLYEEVATLPGVTASSPAMQERSTWSEASSADGNSAREFQSKPAKEIGQYQNRLMWTGMGFEERPVLIVPETFVEVPEPPPAPVLQEMAVETVLANTEEQSPVSSIDLEMAAVAAELPSGAGEEEDRFYSTPESISEHSLLADSRQTTPPVESASELAPSNGSKISHGTSGSDDSRWYVLNGVLSGAPAPDELSSPDGNVPVLAVFSLAGGAGKTSLVAALGKALAARGERVLLVEATPFGSLPYFFGACDCRPGSLRTFRPPASSSDLPIRLATVDPESLPAVSTEESSLAADIHGWAEGASRVIVDVATASIATARSLLPMSPTVLVPLVPDVNSVVAANWIDSFFQDQASAAGVEPEVYYLLNQFDTSRPLHMEIAKVLREGLGERLLPYALDRDGAVGEALADGMTVIDYAPGSALAENYIRIAEWLNHIMAPVQTNARGARWSER